MAELDEASLLFLFSGLPGEALAACAQVCRTWRNVAASEVLWRRKLEELEPHPHLRRDDLLPAFGGSHRAYFAWRWPLLRRRAGRIAVQRDEDAGASITTYPAPLWEGGGPGGGSSGAPQPSTAGGAGQAASGARPMDAAAGGSEPAPGACMEVEPFPPDTSVSLQLAAWAPAGALLAYAETKVSHRQGTAAVSLVVADGRTGRRLGSWVLAPQLMPIYLVWSACCTRLLFLCPTEQVALFTLDVSPALLAPAQRSAAGATREVLLCQTRPLFFSVSPTSTRLLWHGEGHRFGLADAATLTPEDGSDHDCFFENPLAASQTPQWAVDAAGADWLLLPVTHAQAAPGEAGVLVLAPLAAVSEALETEGSRLSPNILLDLSLQVAPFAARRGLIYAATPDASHVAWCNQGEVHVWFRDSGAAHSIFPLPSQPHQPGSTPGGGNGGSNPAFWRGGDVYAMQWSPNGARLLMLVNANTDTPLEWRWMVYDVPPAAPPAAEAGPSAGSGWLGTLTQCRPILPTRDFAEEHLPFFDQYSQSTRLWAPSSDAFCFACYDADMAEDRIGDTDNVYIQPVPRTMHPAGGAAHECSQAAGSSADGPDAGKGGDVLLLVHAPQPVWLAEGSLASWSCQ